jgi:phosphoribosylanthranilate isomerase
MNAPFSEKSFLIKVCGLVREEDARLCLELGVDMTGFLFVPSSPRYIPPENAGRLPRGGAARVGVFAGQSLDFVRAAFRLAGLDYAQLHGGEDADFCRAVGPERVIKVLWPRRLLRPENSGGKAWSGADLPPDLLPDLLHDECSRFAGACACFLLDAGTEGGGSGGVLPWSLLRGFAPDVPWLLAGGLGPRTVEEALAACFPQGIDCNSGVEDAPGKKNPRLLRSLVDSARTLRPSGGKGTVRPVRAGAEQKGSDK